MEVLLTLSDGTQLKMLGDAPYDVRGWLSYLQGNGAPLPATPVMVCNRQDCPSESLSAALSLRRVASHRGNWAAYSYRNKNLLYSPGRADLIHFQKGGA